MSIEKITKNSELAQSKDLIAENIQRLKELFPEAFTEGKIDFTVLRDVLGDEVETEEEYYRFTWAGKAQARREAHKPSTGTLRPYREESVDWDTTENLYIEGDNLEVLKLLQKSYANKVKMIYIDPPYNTGKDFVYTDNYQDNILNYKQKTGQVDEDGNFLTTNTENDGRFHSNWLSMIYPRLKLARNLLTENGVIFISIGVEEFSNLKAVCNEIFGESNFVEVFSWVKTSTPPALSTKSRKTNEYILCYERTKTSIKYDGEPLDGGDQPLLNSGNSIVQLKFPKEKVWFSNEDMQNIELKAGKTDRVRLLKDLKIVDGYAHEDFELEGEFKWTQNFLDNEVKLGTTFIVKSDLFSVRFIRAGEGFKRPTNFIKSKYSTPVLNKPENNIGTNENASSDLIEIMGGDYFDYPKPVSLIKHLIGFLCKENDLVLDFFSGSGTTAEAVSRFNLATGYKLKSISVQLPERLDPSIETDAKRKVKIENTIRFLESLNRPNSIAELGKERLSRVRGLIQTQNPLESQNLDLGYKVFKLDSSNIKGWDGNPDDITSSLFDTQENIKSDRAEEDVLFEILLKYGLDLTLPIEERMIEGKRVFNVGLGALFICLADGITSNVAEGIGAWKEELNPETCRVIFKDSGFTDVEKTNSVQTLKRFGIHEIKSI